MLYKLKRCFLNTPSVPFFSGHPVEVGVMFTFKTHFRTLNPFCTAAYPWLIVNITSTTWESSRYFWMPTVWKKSHL